MFMIYSIFSQKRQWYIEFDLTGFKALDSILVLTISNNGKMTQAGLYGKSIFNKVSCFELWQILIGGTRGLLLNQSKGLSYTAGFTMVKWLRDFLQEMTNVYINPISFSIKWKSWSSVRLPHLCCFSLSSLPKFKWSINWVHMPPKFLIFLYIPLIFIPPCLTDSDT